MTKDKENHWSLPSDFYSKVRQYCDVTRIGNEEIIYIDGRIVFRFKRCKEEYLDHSTFIDLILSDDESFDENESLRVYSNGLWIHYGPWQKKIIDAVRKLYILFNKYDREALKEYDKLKIKQREIESKKIKKANLLFK